MYMVALRLYHSAPCWMNPNRPQSKQRNTAHHPVEKDRIQIHTIYTTILVVSPDDITAQHLKSVVVVRFSPRTNSDLRQQHMILPPQATLLPLGCWSVEVGQELLVGRAAHILVFYCPTQLRETQTSGTSHSTTH